MKQSVNVDTHTPLQLHPHIRQAHVESHWQCAQHPPCEPSLQAATCCVSCSVLLQQTTLGFITSGEGGLRSLNCTDSLQIMIFVCVSGGVRRRSKVSFKKSVASFLHHRGLNLRLLGYQLTGNVHIVQGSL